MGSGRPYVITNGTVVLPDRLVADGAVATSGGRIRSVGRRRGARKVAGAVEIDARGGFIAPGFVDIHVHGGAGADYMDGTADAVRTANRCHARHGTTTTFPTTTTGSPDEIDRMLTACLSVGRAWTVADGARIGGVHFYGPYFAADKVGCHPEAGRRDPDPAEYRRAFSRRVIRVATCAAELPGAEAFYREARRRRCLVTCGHSNAAWPEMVRAYRAGMRHVDHFWCAMSSVPGVRQRLGYPMRGSMAEFVLAHAAMSTEVLADGEHLAPELLDFAFRMKGARRLCLVTDSSRAVDMPPGEYRFGPASNGEWFTSNGKVGYQPGAGLASSVVGMDTMVRNMARHTSATLPEVVRMASLTPAERAGASRHIGSLEPGKRADIVLLTRRLAVSRVLIAGAVFDASGPSR
jgi:N-acetylglucosamine-6-phosphate deacetylase